MGGLLHLSELAAAGFDRHLTKPVDYDELRDYFRHCERSIQVFSAKPPFDELVSPQISLTVRHNANRKSEQAARTQERSPHHGGERTRDHFSTALIVTVYRLEHRE